MGETYSPTVNSESVNATLDLASLQNARVYIIDVSGAFLHVPLGGVPLHMRLGKEVATRLTTLDPSFVPDLDPDGTIVVRIHKAIYGLGGSSRQWSDHVAATLGSCGYHRLQYDRNVFIKKNQAGSTESLLCVHVDDILAADFLGDARNDLTAALVAAYGKIKVHDGDTLTHLGVNIERRNGAFHLDQRHLISLLD